ncbi:MAG TPA: ribonucleoside triphosphate reductase [Candidatus Marinimicrobia bacterium]|nr:ribonucleoside triphosphate reductase [Candidatus Neomarinimicrobiota bacterium]
MSTISKITKRNGVVADFDSEKIYNAILKAGQAAAEFGFDIAHQLTAEVLQDLQASSNGHIINVEEIQDSVEMILLQSHFKKTAKAYILYRDQHAKLRDISSRHNADLIDQYLSRADWKVNENSNMSYSLQGLNNYISQEISKNYWLTQIYPDAIRAAHLNGALHIHDLGILSVYCVGWDLYDLLLQGFKGAGGKMESKPAKHFRSALGQVVNFFYTLQGEAAGAQAFSNFDTLLAPFIHYDGLSYKEVKQALQEFLFNINVPTRVGFQTPFTNITLDLTVPQYFKDQGVIIGGAIMDKSYAEFQKEIDILNNAFLEVMLEGDAKGRVFTFPIPTYNLTRDFDWDSKTSALLWKATAKYGIPYFANFVNSDMNPEDVRSMCCRLRIDNRKLAMRGGGLFGSAPLTGSVGVVTINLPRIGYQVNSKESFFKTLGELMELAKQSLEIKRKLLERLTDEHLYPYTNFYLRHVKERFGKYWKNHFSTIGIIGMNEACLNLLGCDIGTAEGNRFAVEVLDFMRAKLLEFQTETGNNYNLEATPAEGTSHRLARLDKKAFPDIITANQSNDIERVYYTNSSQLPVNYTDDLFESLDLQDELQTKYTGGTVLHLFMGERIQDEEALKKLIRTVCTKYRLPYFSITPTFSICPECGYLDGELENCPKCESRCEIYSRVVGYLRPVQQWNKGKQAEFQDRRTFAL